MALDPDGHRLFVVADGKQVLVQDLTDSTRPPERLSFGPTLRVQVELGEGQDIHFGCQLVRNGAPSEIRRDSYTHRMKQGFRTGFHVWLPGKDPGSAPQFYGPEELDKMQNAIAAVEEGEVIAIGGRVFGDHVGDAKPGLHVACNDGDSDLGRTLEVQKVDGGVLAVSMAWGGTFSLTRCRTSQPNAQMRHNLQSLGARPSTLDVARHGDVLVLVAVKGRPDSARLLHVAAERLVNAFDRGSIPEKLAAIEWQLSQQGLVTGLAYDRHRKILLLATPTHLLAWDVVKDTRSWLKIDGRWAQRAGSITVDQDRGLLFFPTAQGAYCLDVCNPAGDASLPVAGVGVPLQGVRHVLLHGEWLLLTHADGVAVVDQNRGLQVDVARCQGAVASAVVRNQVAVMFDQDVRLAGWSLGDIGARLARMAAGGGYEQPPSPVPWIGLGTAGFPVPGLCPQKTALTGIADIVEHRNEVFVAHGKGVFVMSLTRPPLQVPPEVRGEVDAILDFPNDFAVAFAAPVRHDAAKAPPYKLAPITHSPEAPLWMSPVLQPANGERWAAVFPLRVPCGPLIVGLAPFDDCLANADLLSPEARPRKPRVDGVLIHQPNNYDDSSRAVRLHEVVKEEGGKWAWSVGTDLWRKLQEKMGMVDDRCPPFFMGDSGGNMAVNLEGSCRPNDRGGIVYQLERVRLRGLDRNSKGHIDLIDKPLKEFVMGQSRPVRFYICTLDPQPVGESTGAGTSPAPAQRDLQWVPEHVPYMYLLAEAKV